MDVDHLLQCIRLDEYPADDIVNRYWKARRQMVKKTSSGIGQINKIEKLFPVPNKKSDFKMANNEQTNLAVISSTNQTLNEPYIVPFDSENGMLIEAWTATAGSDVVQSRRPIFDDFFQHLWLYIGNNTANVVFEMVKRLWLIRIDQ
ncbi:hypothetical protein TNCV_4845081 [Trichonephila clavipes]|uniref:Uncharacterized protein n=1 Tax=Trichonephila clavipes TaxID=2585209 RepID=A0A8X7BL96_TRICX|nr:hypothetical protein TNCV_4845081 [Trichonephila clavipes]